MREKSVAGLPPKTAADRSKRGRLPMRDRRLSTAGEDLGKSRAVKAPLETVHIRSSVIRVHGLLTPKCTTGNGREE